MIQKVGRGTHDRNGILTDVLEPDEFKSTVAIAVNTLLLVLANDGILQRTTLADDKDSIVDAWMRRYISATPLTRSRITYRPHHRRKHRSHGRTWPICHRKLDPS